MTKLSKANDARPKTPPTIADRNSQPAMVLPAANPDQHDRTALLPAADITSPPGANLLLPADAGEATETAMMKAIQRSADAQEYFSQHLGAKLSKFQQQMVIRPTRVRADLIACHQDSDEPTAVFEIISVPMDATHVDRVKSYARLLDVKDALIITPEVPGDFRHLTGTTQNPDRNGITLHLIRVITFHQPGQNKSCYGFEPITAAAPKPANAAHASSEPSR